MEYFKRLHKFWFPNWTAFLWLLLALPGLLFFQTTVHEGTHAMVALIDNGDFPKLAPFPHLTKNGGNFLAGVTIPDKSVRVTERRSCDPKNAPQTFDRLAGWIGWPQIIALLLVVGFTPIFVFANITNPFFAFLLRTWYFGAVIDFTFNTAKNLFCICDASQDWSRVMIRGDINPTLFWFLTLFLWLVIVFHIAWLGWPKREPPTEIGFWDYRWIAFILGIMSILAIVFSRAVSDNLHIDKDTIFYVVPVLGQVFAAFFYWVYFAMTFNRRKLPVAGS